LHILEDKKGTILVGFRRIEIGFDDSDEELNDDAVYVGYRLRF
jgi:hypothetical protein